MEGVGDDEELERVLLCEKDLERLGEVELSPVLLGLLRDSPCQPS
jgi:hypothetical protein